MDEMEKYQQRLQAIAEKRRLQEEQDRAKRQLEDEKLRQQQLKRKSLRDQWLMEGPLSPDSTGPRSPLWDKQTQQIEAHIDKLQSEAVENTHKHTEDSSTSALSHTDHLGNGETVNAVIPPLSESSVTGGEKITDSSHNTSLSNGTARDETSHDVPLQHVNDVSQGAETLLFLGYTEAEPGQGLCDDDDDVSAVIRAERVIITEEGEEVTEEPRDMHAEEEDEEEEEREEAEEEEEKEQEKLEEEEMEEEEEKTGVEVEEEVREEDGMEEQEEEMVEKREREEVDEGKEEDVADVENLKLSPEVDEVTEKETVLGQNSTEVNTGADSSKEDSNARIAAPTDEETSVNTDTDTDTKPVKDSTTESASNTDLTGDVEPEAETHTHSLTETPGGVIPSDSIALPDSPLNPNGDQKSLASPSTNVAAQFQDIPLDGATVEEEPLLVTKVEPLTTDATNPNQADRAKTKSCQCCSVM